MSDLIVQSETQLRAVLDQITFAPSCVNMGWQWQIEELRLHSNELRGWLVNTTFRRPDTHTGKIGQGAGRKELISYGASETAVVKTAWLLAELIVRHELMEAFLYRGMRLFDPHYSVDALSGPALTRCPACSSPSSVTFTREEEHFPYGVAPDTVELTALVDKGRCSACSFAFTDYRAEKACDAAVQAHLAACKGKP